MECDVYMTPKDARQIIESVKIPPDIKLSLFEYIEWEKDMARVVEFLDLVREYEALLEAGDREAAETLEKLIARTEEATKIQQSAVKKEFLAVERATGEAEDKKKISHILQSIKSLFHV